MPFLFADELDSWGWFPKGASTFAKQVDFLYYALLANFFIFFVPIVILMLVFMWKYRPRPGYKGSPDALHHTGLEITWTVIPTLIVVWIFWEGATGYLKMATPPKGTIDIQVTAKKWSWSFKYPNGGEDPVLCVPVGKDVKLVMRSEDVLHSLYVPAFRVKRDVVPGRYNYMWFHATEIGDYHLFCTEYCGDNHSEMKTTVKVVSTEDYQKFLDKAIQEPEDPLERGKVLYKRLGCATCHNAGVEGAKGPGPSYNGSWGKPVQLENGSEVPFDENYVRTAILNPQAQARKGFGSASPMNSFAGRVKDEQIDALITFIKSLENEAPPAK